MPDEIMQPAGVLVEGPDWLTQEKLDGLTKGEITLDSLEPKQREEFHGFLEHQVTGKSLPAAKVEPAAAPAAPAGTPAAPAAAPAAAAPSGDIRSPADIPAKRPQDQQKFWQERERLLADNNRQKQLLQKHERDTATLKEKIAELSKKPITAPSADPFDSSSLLNLRERLEKSEAMVEALTGHVQSTTGLLQQEYSNRSAQLEADTVLVGLERFQIETQNAEEFPESLSLKTTVPLADLKTEIEEFAAAVGGLENVNKYLSDEAFRIGVEARGHKLSEAFIANLDKYNRIWAINKDVVEGKAPDHKVAYLSHIIREGKLKEWQRSVKLDGANAVATELSRKANNTPLLPPNEGPRPAAAGWTIASARQWYAEHPDVKPGSPDEATKKMLSEMIRSGQLR